MRYLTFNPIRGHRRGVPSMKHPIDMHVDPVMRFFTPELYVRFNSSDDEVADLANDEWEIAIESYQKHLDQIRDRLPSHVRNVSELCLRDAEVLTFQKEIQVPAALFDASRSGPAWSVMAMLGLKQGDAIWTLLYFLADRVREYPAPADWPFAKQKKHWLYDEIDLAPGFPHVYLHRVLYSDGSVAEIPFGSVIAMSMPLHEATAHKSVG